MTQERKNPPDADNRISAETRKKERAIAAVIATNALISPEQFQALRGALGREVMMEYHFHKDYSDEADGNPPDDSEDIESFVLEDVNFVRDSRTQQLYLAFFRDEKDDATNFPYWESENAFGDVTQVEIHCLSLPSEEVLWGFGFPRTKISNMLGLGAWGRSLPDFDIWQDIKDHSESMRVLEKS